MKKLLYLIPLVILFSCGGPNHEKQIEKPITEKVIDTCRSFLVYNLDDPSSYSSKDWSTVDSVYLDDIFNDGPYRKYRLDFLAYSTYKKIIERDKASGFINDKFNPYEEELIKYSSNAERYKILLDSFSLLYKNDFIGYKVRHEFRSKNKFGSLELKKLTFWVGRNYQVLNSVDSIH